MQTMLVSDAVAKTFAAYVAVTLSLKGVDRTNEVGIAADKVYMALAATLTASELGALNIMICEMP